MKKEIDFSKGVRGKHSHANLKVLGAVKSSWAVCIETKEKSLIPFKLYQIETFSNSTDIRLTNERGEAKYYPATWFVPIQISKKTLGILEKSV